MAIKFIKRRESHPPDPPGDSTRISVTARWDFHVQDAARFLEYVRGRLKSESAYTPDDIQDHVRDVESAVLALFELDGWRTSTYEPHGIGEAGSGVNTESIDKTLFEMDVAERLESGY